MGVYVGQVGRTTFFAGWPDTTYDRVVQLVYMDVGVVLFFYSSTRSILRQIRCASIPYFTISATEHLGEFAF